MARLQSVLDALQVFLPGVFVVVVVWIGARYAVEGRITAGELVAFYGYSAFLMIPLRTATEFANKLIRARVSRPAGLPRAGADLRPRSTPAHPAASPAVGLARCATCAPGCEVPRRLAGRAGQRAARRVRGARRAARA